MSDSTLSVDPLSSHRQLPARIGVVASGAFLFYLLFQIWSFGDILAHPGVALLCLLLFCLATSLVLAALLDPLPRGIGHVAFAILMLCLTIRVAVLCEVEYPIYRTDSIAFTHKAAALVLEGRNPYPVDLAPSLGEFGVPGTFVTPYTDGRIENRVTYPALNFLIHVPFLALGFSDLRYVVLLFQLATLVLIHLRTPVQLRPLAVIPVLADYELVEFTGGGVTDFVWVFFLCLMILAWRRRFVAAALLGLACATKQPPWVLAPFVLLRVWLEMAGSPPDVRAREVARFLGTALGVFAVLNLPFALADPRSWYQAVGANLQAPMILFGDGLSLVSQFGLLGLPRLFYKIAAAITATALALIYALRFRQMREALWIFPAIVLWSSPRSFHNYYAYWIPLILMALVGRPDPADQKGLPGALPSARERTWTVAILATALAGLLATGALTLRLGSQRTARVDLLDANNASSGGWLSEMRVRIRNEGQTRLEPTLAVRWSHWQPFAWQIQAGPSVVGAGQSVSLRVSTADRWKMVPPGRSFFVQVIDLSTGEIVGRSRTYDWSKISEAARLAQEAAEDLRDGHPIKAEERLRRSLELHETSPGVHLMLSQAYRTLGENGKAREHLDEARRLDPTAAPEGAAPAP